MPVADPAATAAAETAPVSATAAPTASSATAPGEPAASQSAERLDDVTVLVLPGFAVAEAATGSRTFTLGSGSVSAWHIFPLC